jgi:hypothetical protein
MGHDLTMNYVDQQSLFSFCSKYIYIWYIYIYMFARNCHLVSLSGNQTDVLRSLIMRKRNSQISICQTHSDHLFLMIYMWKMIVWWVCMHVSMRVLLVHTYIIMLLRNECQWSVVIIVAFRGHAPSSSSFLRLDTYTHIYMRVYVCMFEKSMHVYIVTKCDWSLRTYKHVA